MIRAFTVETSVIVIANWVPASFRNKALSVRRLQAIVLQFIGVLAEGAIGLVGEDLVELCPEVVEHSVILSDHLPKV